jgi:hypothetical protein
MRITIHADKVLKYDFGPSDLEHARKTVREIGDLMGRFISLRQKIAVALFSSPDIFD